MCGNEFFKDVIDGKVSVKAQEKNYFRQNNWTPFFCLLTVCKLRWECRSATELVQNGLQC